MLSIRIDIDVMRHKWHLIRAVGSAHWVKYRVVWWGRVDLIICELEVIFFHLKCALENLNDFVVHLCFVCSSVLKGL